MEAHLEACRVTLRDYAQLKGVLDRRGSSILLALSLRPNPHYAVLQSLQRVPHGFKVPLCIGPCVTPRVILPPLVCLRSDCKTPRQQCDTRAWQLHLACLDASELSTEERGAALVRACVLALLGQLLPHSLLHVRFALGQSRPCVRRHRGCDE